MNKLKKLFIAALVLIPLVTFSDGGNPFLYCSSYIKYDVQPTLISALELDAYSIKINGIEQPIVKDSVRTSWNTLPEYKRNLMYFDTLNILDMQINEANTDVNCINMNGDFCKE